jgi:hypothetical protein
VTIPTSVDVDAPVVARHDIHVQAPLTSVWALHVDVNGWTRWNSDMTSAHLDGPFAPGATFQWESYGFPVTSSVYEVEPHRRILWGGTAGGITGVHEWLFTPVAGGVHVETNESFAGAPVDADAVGMQSLLDASLEDWLRHLKEASEATTAV